MALFCLFPHVSCAQMFGWTCQDKCFDAVVKWNNNKAYLFKGGQYLRYSGEWADDGYPRDAKLPDARPKLGHQGGEHDLGQHRPDRGRQDQPGLCPGPEPSGGGHDRRDGLPVGCAARGAQREDCRRPRIAYGRGEGEDRVVRRPLLTLVWPMARLRPARYTPDQLAYVGPCRWSALRPQCGCEEQK